MCGPIGLRPSAAGIGWNTSIRPRRLISTRCGPAASGGAAQTAAARNFVNEISGSTRMLAHGLLYVGKGNLPYIQEQIDKNEPDAWKGYNISFAAKVDTDPMSPMRQWRHDDEAVAYPTFELIQKTYQKIKDKKPGFKNICVHKGLAPGPPNPERDHPADLPKALKDWPSSISSPITPASSPHFSWANRFGNSNPASCAKASPTSPGPPNTRFSSRRSRMRTPKSGEASDPHLIRLITITLYGATTHHPRGFVRVISRRADSGPTGAV